MRRDVRASTSRCGSAPQLGCTCADRPCCSGCMPHYRTAFVWASQPVPLWVTEGAACCIMERLHVVRRFKGMYNTTIQDGFSQRCMWTGSPHGLVLRHQLVHAHHRSVMSCDASRGQGRKGGATKWCQAAHASSACREGLISGRCCGRKSTAHLALCYCKRSTIFENAAQQSLLEKWRQGLKKRRVTRRFFCISEMQRAVKHGLVALAYHPVCMHPKHIT